MEINGMESYDVIIIGSGLGGLLCGDILSRNGFKVCVLEKNPQTGGCLQTFMRDGSVFDTGMHYVGALDEGQILHKIFSYLKIKDNLKIRRLDENGYDVIRFHDREYLFAMGYQGFIENFSRHFPADRKAIEEYAGKVREISEIVDPCNNTDNENRYSRYLEYYSTGYDLFLQSLFKNSTLRRILTGMSPVYAGVREKSPLYIPMMIHSTYINGAYRFIDGGSQLSEILTQNIRENGGAVLTRAEVTRLFMERSEIRSVEIKGKERLEGKFVISGIHPKRLLSLMDGNAFTPAYTRRIKDLEETFGMFSLYLSSKEYAFRYVNRNYYCYHTGNPWDIGNYNRDNWPKGYMVHFSPVSEKENSTNAVILNTFMKWNEMEPWVNTKTGERGESYEAFKQKKAEKLLFLLKRDFPELHSSVTSSYTSTPLTYRDYTNTFQGSAYGILKDYRKPYNTMILPKTHVPNLLLTGQNINTHGVVGVAIGALLTCYELLGKEYLNKKICHG